MQRKKEIPKSPRNSLISKLAYEMLVRIGAEKLPINLDDILNLYPKIILVPYTEFKKDKEFIPDRYNFDLINARIDKQNAAEPNPAKWKEHLEAFTIPIEDKYFIYYDDRVRNEGRIRWSICHELGHIFIEHFTDFDLRTSNFVNITDKQYGVLELEAHWYASEVLAPGPVMFFLRKKLTSEHISLLCDISSEAAWRKKCYIELKKYEGFIENRPMMLNFSHFIFDTGYWDSVYRVLRERLELHPRLIREKYDECRVCKSCYAFVHNSWYSHCQYCGEELEKQHQFSMNRMHGIEQPVLDGKVYPSFEESRGWRALFCPRCKNHEFSKNDEFCPACHTPLYNRCLEHKAHNNKLSLECRRCPGCGGLTTYSELYDELKEYRIPPPSRYKSYHRFEEWGYIRFSILNKLKNSKGMRIYAILSDSAVYTDYDNFVLIITGEIKHAQELLNNMRIVEKSIEVYFTRVRELHLFYYDKIKHEIYNIVSSKKIHNTCSYLINEEVDIR